jgi:hypothetical protein
VKFDPKLSRQIIRDICGAVDRYARDPEFNELVTHRIRVGGMRLKIVHEIGKDGDYPVVMGFMEE